MELFPNLVGLVVWPRENIVKLARWDDFEDFTTYLYAKLTTVGLLLGGVLIVAGVVVIPTYGGYKLYRHYSTKKAIRQQHENTQQEH